MSEEKKIKVNDLPNEQGTQEAELPVLNNEGKSESKKEHGESGCCGVCGTYLKFSGVKYALWARSIKRKAQIAARCVKF